MSDHFFFLIKNRFKKALFILTILAFFLPYTVVCSMSAPPSNPAPLLWGTALDGYPVTDKQLDKIESDTKLCPAMVVFFLQWPAQSQAGGFPITSLNTILQRGAVPCITWEPMYYEDGVEKMVPFQKILNGGYDLYLNDFAHQAKAFNQPFIIRFAHEMNLQRYHWGTSQKEFGPQSPQIYQQIFRYVVNLFRRQGAGQVLWAFCPNAESVPNMTYDPTSGWNKPFAYYPGDDYVDILGMDGYNWGTTQTLEKHGWKSSWKTFEEIFFSIYRELNARAPQKPLFVFETACADMGGEKSKWIAEAFHTLNKWKVQGVVWFQVRKEIDWRINSSGNLSYTQIVKRSASPGLFWIKQAKE